jgi:peptidoglycan hydrolase-like protein with peptidoglycan-binding domain
MSTEDVRRLQTLLASDKHVYPEGIVSGYFGHKTREAVERFQLKHGVVSSNNEVGYGFVGPKTRAKLQEVFGGASSDITPLSATSSASISFSVNLGFGMTSSDVYRLQQLLATDSEIYPEGIVSGYFGHKTREAVERFQLKHGVVSSNNEVGYGFVGPKTRAKLGEVFK